MLKISKQVKRRTSSPEASSDPKMNRRRMSKPGEPLKSRERTIKSDRKWNNFLKRLALRIKLF